MKAMWVTWSNSMFDDCRAKNSNESKNVQNDNLIAFVHM